TRLEEMKSAAGVAKEDEELINQALEEPEKWQQLLDKDPHLAAYAQALRDVSDMMTAGELRFGTIGQALQGRIAHAFQGVAGADKEAEPVGVFGSWLRAPAISKSRIWRMAMDGETGDIQFSGKTRSEILKELEERTKFYEQTHEHRQVYNTNRSRINT